jgi:hypothetical protein
MKGCNHWVGGGQPRGLITPWRPHALVDRGMSQYWLVRSADFCRYGQASHSLLVPNLATIGEAPHRLTSVRGRRLRVPFGAKATINLLHPAPAGVSEAH